MISFLNIIWCILMQLGDIAYGYVLGLGLNYQLFLSLALTKAGVSCLDDT